MGEEDKRPFELEPEDEKPKPRTPRPSATPQPESYEERAAEQANRRLEDGAGEDDVDSRTVAERAGTGIPRGNEVVGAPADWPAEAFSFPFRAPGPGLLIAGTLVLLPLDLLMLTPVAFFGWLLKLLSVAFLLRAQIAVIGSTAAGHDVPSGWQRALVFDRDDLWPYARTLLAFVLLVAPGCFVLAFGSKGLGLLLIALGSMYASVVALGAALEDPGLGLPWRAPGWIVRAPLSCLAGSGGWWLFVVAEWTLSSLTEPALPLVAFLSVILRAVCFYGLLVSARAIGVMGRAWSAT